MMCFKSISITILMGLCAPLTFAETISEILPNGLKVIIKEDKRAPVVVSQIWYRIGSIDEITAKTGVSHVLEHMMFKGTKDVPAGEFSRRIAALGGNDNAFTSRNQTVYYQNFAAAALPEVLKLEADRMANLNFSDKDFANEIKVVQEERRLRTDDQPSGVLWEAIYANALIANPARNPVIGWMSDLENMTPNDARAWYKQWYTPSNATLVLVGDMDAAKTLNDVKQIFGKVKKTELPERRPQPEPTQNGIKRVTVHAPSELPFLTLSYQVPHLQKLTDKTPYALAVLSAVLDGHAASRLEKRLVREAHVATSVGTSYDFFNRGESLFTITGVPAQNVNLDQLETALRNQIADIAKNGVSEKELQMIHTQIEASKTYEKDSISSQAMSIGTMENYGFSYKDEAEIDRRMMQVTSAEIQEAAKMLVDNKLTIVTLLPEPSSSATNANIQDQTNIR